MARDEGVLKRLTQGSAGQKGGLQISAPPEIMHIEVMCDWQSQKICSIAESIWNMFWRSLQVVKPSQAIKNEPPDCITCLLYYNACSMCLYGLCDVYILPVHCFCVATARGI